MLAPSFSQSALQSMKEPEGSFMAECRVTNCATVCRGENGGSQDTGPFVLKLGKSQANQSELVT